MSKNDQIDELITSAITSSNVSEQSQIIAILKNNNIEINQSSLSRRMKKIGIIKINGCYKLPATSSCNENIIFINMARPNMIVIHTTPGMASSIAFKIDQFLDFKQNKVRGILATIAGDDTILVIIDVKYRIEVMLEAIESLLAIF
jgi:transcriptional regulator of arginine metabolism